MQNTAQLNEVEQNFFFNFIFNSIQDILDFIMLKFNIHQVRNVDTRIGINLFFRILSQHK